ncbi:Uncharacterised protein [Pseudomonas luteola]|uniref:Uncharacterized protein n=2 Tax=Pseudomonas TaxID=286 RepID=A0A2X2CCX1_PSELU|nr:hypothetical protein SAMN05216409_114103 [Pseudomonas lutea]SPZ04983.1 Uncharacterised protein [Pseudomonas luteola]
MSQETITEMTRLLAAARVYVELYACRTDSSAAQDLAARIAAVLSIQSDSVSNCESYGCIDYI